MQNNTCPSLEIPFYLVIERGKIDRTFQYVFIEIHQSVKGDRLIDTFLVYTHGNGWIELISRYNENGNSGDSIVPRFQNSSFLWKFELNLLHSVLKKISLKI